VKKLERKTQVCIDPAVSGRGKKKQKTKVLENRSGDGNKREPGGGVRGLEEQKVALAKNERDGRMRLAGRNTPASLLPRGKERMGREEGDTAQPCIVGRGARP